MHVCILGEGGDGERTALYKPGLYGSSAQSTGKTNGVWGLAFLGVKIYLPHV